MVRNRHDARGSTAWNATRSDHTELVHPLRWGSAGASGSQRPEPWAGRPGAAGEADDDDEGGDVFRHEQPGRGGWGDPLERDPARVLRDVRNERLSLGAARDDYGVVIDVGTWTVDQTRTAQRRAELRAQRGSAAPIVEP